MDVFYKLDKPARVDVVSYLSVLGLLNTLVASDMRFGNPVPCVFPIGPYLNLMRTLTSF